MMCSHHYPETENDPACVWGDAAHYSPENGDTSEMMKYCSPIQRAVGLLADDAETERRRDGAETVMTIELCAAANLL